MENIHQKVEKLVGKLVIERMSIVYVYIRKNRNGRVLDISGVIGSSEEYYGLGGQCPLSYLACKYSANFIIQSQFCYDYILPNYEVKIG